MSEGIDETRLKEDEVRLKEVLRLIESDHKATTDYISRLTALRTAVRSVVFPLASALAGLALVNKSWVISAVAIPTVVIGVLSEARTDFLLNIAHRRLVRLEYKIQAYLDYLIETGTVAADAQKKLSREIDGYQFGISRSLRGSSFRKTIAITAKTAVFWLYCALLAALVAVSAITAAADRSKVERPKVCLVDQSGSLVQLTELPEIREGRVSLVECP